MPSVATRQPPPAPTLTAAEPPLAPPSTFTLRVACAHDCALILVCAQSGAKLKRDQSQFVVRLADLRIHELAQWVRLADLRIHELAQWEVERAAERVREEERVALATASSKQ